MPWVSSGYGAQTNWHWTGLNTYNLGGSPITMPATGAITKVKMYTGGRGGTVSMRLMLWDHNAKFLRNTAQFTAAKGTDKIGGQFWYEKNLSSPVVRSSGQVVYVGHWRDPAKAGYLPGGGSGTLYRRTVTSGGATAALGKSNNRGTRLMVELFYITAPAVPTNISVTRSSDVKHTVKWVRKATTDRPYTNIRVQRWDNVSAAWSTKATLAGTATSWVDSGTVANRKYRYRVAATNAAGDSSYVTSAYVYTTPGAPSGLKMTRVSDTEQKLSWTRATYAADVWQNVEVQRWDHISASWSTIATLAGTATSYSDKTTAANRKYRYRVRSKNSSASSAYVTTDYVYTTPGNPSGCSVSRVSDVRHTISWVNAPYVKDVCTALKIQRWDNAQDQWYELTSLSVSSGPTTFSDSTTRADRQYRYRVKGVNTGVGSGELSSAYSTSAYVYTSPLAPASPTVLRRGADVEIRCTIASVIADQLRIEHSIDGGPFVHLVTAGVETSSFLYVHQAPGGGEHKYRLRTEVSADLARVSAFIETGSVVTIQPPGPPTGLSPNGTVFDADEEQEFRWTHAPLDGSVQTAFELGYRLSGESSWTTVSGGSVNRFTAEAGLFSNGKTVEWRVRTKGAHEDWGDWSAVAVVMTSARPRAIIMYPALDFSIHGFPYLTVEWDYSDQEDKPQTNYVLTLLSMTGGELEQVSGTTDVREADLKYNLRNETEYRLSLRLRDADGMWSNTVYRMFRVEYEGPDVPELEAEFSAETGQCEISVKNPPVSEGKPDVKFNRVFRRIDDGPEVLIADNVPCNAVLIDFVPGVRNRNVYYAVAVSDFGSQAVSADTEVVTDIGMYFWLNSGPGFGEHLRFLYNADFSFSYGRDTALHQFEGRKWPLQFQGERVEEKWQLSAVVEKEFETRIKKIVHENIGVLCYRDYFGRRFFVSISDVAFRKASHGMLLFSCSLTRVEDVVI